VTARRRPVRALQVARRGAIKARTQAGNQLRDLIVTAPGQLRDKLAALTTVQRVTMAARFRPGGLTSPAEAAKAAMAAVARRHQVLTAEITQLDTSLEALAAHAAPAGFLARAGVGTQVASILLTTAGDNPGRLRTEASFAAVCGSSPVDASSGKQRRHRLNRGGDRQASCALWRIVFTRMACDPRTQAYVARRTAEGKTRKEIMRCLKRYVAREICKALVTQAAHPRAASRSHRRPEPVSTQATYPPDTVRADRHASSVLTSGLALACHYAAARPDCQVLATIRYGQIALCARCDQRRSTAGKGTPPARLPGPHALLQVAAAKDACQQATAALREAVTRARQAGHSWSTIAAILNVTRQAAQQRFARTQHQKVFMIT
jgi:hypothetical protein